MKIPVFCPTKIQYDFDQQRIKKELLDVGIFDHSKVATTVYQNGKSMWQPDGVFEHEDFKKVKNIHHYTVDKDGNGNDYYPVLSWKPRVKGTKLGVKSPQMLDFQTNYYELKTNYKV